MCRYDWILTIVLSVVVPLYLLSGWLHAKASVGFAQIRRQALQEATEVSLELLTKVLEQYNIMLMPNLSLILLQTAVESVENIETVSSLGLEQRMYTDYKQKIKKPTR